MSVVVCEHSHNNTRNTIGLAQAHTPYCRCRRGMQCGMPRYRQHCRDERGSATIYRGLGGDALRRELLGPARSVYAGHEETEHAMPDARRVSGRNIDSLRAGVVQSARKGRVATEARRAHGQRCRYRHWAKQHRLGVAWNTLQALSLSLLTSLAPSPSPGPPITVPILLQCLCLCLCLSLSIPAARAATRPMARRFRSAPGAAQRPASVGGVARGAERFAVVNPSAGTVGGDRSGGGRRAFSCATRGATRRPKSGADGRPDRFPLTTLSLPRKPQT
jgi:hypothetical protein